MLLEQWRKAALLWKTLSVDLRISSYKTNSVYTWLDNDWTLRKKCNWCFLIETVLLTQNVTECLYILQKLWQMLYEQQLKESLTRLLKASICIEENLTEDIHWLCSKSAVKWEFYKPFNDYKSPQQESDTKIMQRDDCRMSDSDICTTFLLSLWALYHNSLRLRNSVCEQSVKKNLSAIEDYTKSVHSLSLKNWWGDRTYESECWTLHLYVL